MKPKTVKRRALLVAVVFAVLTILSGFAVSRLIERAGLPHEQELMAQLVAAIGAGLVGGGIVFLLTWRLGLAVWRAAQAERARLAQAEQWKVLFDRGPDAAFLMGGGRVTAANEAAAELFRCPVEEIVGRVPLEFAQALQRDGSSSEDAGAKWLREARAGAILRFPWALHRADGTPFDSEVSLTVIPTDPRSYLAWVRDVTERERAETERREAVEKYRSIFDNAVEGIYQTDMAGRFVAANPMMAWILGFDTPEELLSSGMTTGADFYTEAARRADFVKLISMKGAVAGFESAVRRRDGAQIWISENARVMRDGRGEIIGFEGTVVDVTSHKRAEQALLESEERYRRLVELSPDAIVVHSEKGIEYINAAATRLFGAAYPHEVIGRRWLEFVDPEHHDVMKQGATVAQAAQETAVEPVEARFFRLDGTAVSAEVLASAFVYEGRPATQVVIRDITERKKLEAARLLLATAVEQATEAILITDTAGAIEYANPAFERVTGYKVSEVVGRNPKFLKSGKQDRDFYRRMWETILRGDVWSGHITNVSKGGELFEEESSITPIRDGGGAVVKFVSVNRDVTAQVVLEQQLRHAQKLEAVGLLAGGVAHDFNNLLQALLATVEIVRARGDDPSRRAVALVELEALIKRGAALARQLLLFSRREVMKKENVDLNDLVRQTSLLLRRLVRANIQFREELAGDALRVVADRGQLEQVLVNLVVNASDAMPSGGALVVRTGGNGDGEVWFEVEDWGVGIPEDLHGKIFEPFFTTKAPESGTGLGLSVVHGIVAGHDGRIELRSKPREGSAFRVVLPRTEGASQAVQPGAAAAEVGPGGGKGEHVLVVEDEDSARAGLEDVLAMLGYEVVSAASAEEAQQLAEIMHVDLLLTDVMLPGVSGWELAQRWRNRFPETKILMMSGYTVEEAVRDEVRVGRVRFLQKPFGMELLAREVRAALDGPATL